LKNFFAFFVKKLCFSLFLDFFKSFFISLEPSFLSNAVAKVATFFESANLFEDFFNFF
jgi:hypothetical protein